MFNPVFIRSLVYAGLLSNILALIVLLIFNESESIIGKSFSLLIWTCVYFLHRKMGTW
jgi:hypothetical protein